MENYQSGESTLLNNLHFEIATRFLRVAISLSCVQEKTGTLHVVYLVIARVFAGNIVKIISENPCFFLTLKWG